MKNKKILALVLTLTLLLASIPVGLLVSADTEIQPLTGTVTGVNSEYFALNLYKYNNANDGFGQTSGARNDIAWDRPSMYDDFTGVTKLNDAGTAYRWPYIAFKVDAAEDGEYTIGTKISFSGKITVKSLPMIIDGVVNAVRYTENNNKADVSLRTYLSKGEHIIIVLPPMPEYEYESPTVKGSASNDWNKYAYDWCNFVNFTLSDGLSAIGAPTVAEIKESVENKKVQAEDTSKVIYNGGYKADGSYAGGVSRSKITETYETLANSHINKAGIAYIEYTVNAPADGKYNIRIGAQVGGSGVNNKPFFTVLVNDNVYKAQYDGKFTSSKADVDFINLTVDMKKGLNTVRVTCITKDQGDAFSKNWVNHDWIELQSGLSAVAVANETIKAGDESLVLFSNYTDKGDTLENAVTTNIRGNDMGSIELLKSDIARYLDRWPSASIKVIAAKDGYYDITLNATTNASLTSEHIALVIDNAEVIPLKFTKGGTLAIDASCYLTAGEHLLTFTSPMPLTKADVGTKAEIDAANSWAYKWPWMNMNSIVIPNTLSGTAPIVYNTVNAGDETKVYFEKFTDNGDTLGSAKVDDLKWDSLSIETFTAENLYRMPFAVIKVKASEDGTYMVNANINTRADATSKTIGVLVDGTQKYVGAINNNSISNKIYLTKGEHVILFTTAMPEKQSQAPTERPNAENGYHSMLYPWFDFNSFKLEEGLTVLDAPNQGDAYHPGFNRIEAENPDYTVYKGYEKVETDKNVPSQKVVGGAYKSNITQTFEDLSVWVDGAGGHMPYVEYAVTAPADGEYALRVGVVPGSNDKNLPVPYVAVIANKDVYKVACNGQWGRVNVSEVKVQLVKGMNIIRVTGLTKDQDVKGISFWVNQDFVDFDKTLINVKRSSVIAEAEDSKFNQYFTVNDGTDAEKASGKKLLGNANTRFVKGVSPYIDSLTIADMKYVPFYSYTIDVPMNGYYNIGARYAGDGRLKQSQFALIIDGEITALPYSRISQSTEPNQTTQVVYFTEGAHTVTVTTPLPKNADDVHSWSYRWINHDALELFDGITVAKEQVKPFDIEALVAYEAEEYGLPNFTKYSDTVIGNGAYARAQTAEQMLKNGIDLSCTPCTQYIITASEAGEYELFFSHNYSRYKDAKDVTELLTGVSVNGKVQVVKSRVESDSTHYQGVYVKLQLNKGENKIIVTNGSYDSFKTAGYVWVDFDSLYIPATASEKLSVLKYGTIIEAEASEFSGFTIMENSGYSNGKYLGKGDYGIIDMADLTFDKFDPKNPGEYPRVVYTVSAKKAGKYDIGIQFSGGSLNYSFEEITKLGGIGYIVAVNGENKQLVNFKHGPNAKLLCNIVTVELKEGVNQIMVGVPPAEYQPGVTPRIEEIRRIYFMDMDGLIIPETLALEETPKVSIEDTDIGYGQLKVKKAKPVSDVGEPSFGWIVWVAVAAVVVLAALVIFLIIFKKKKAKN